MKHQVAVAALWFTAQVALAASDAPVRYVEPYAAGVLAYPASLVRRETVTVPGATFLRVHFRSFRLAAGDTLAIAAPDGRDLARYRERGLSGTGDFWSFSVTGD